MENDADGRQGAQAAMRRLGKGDLAGLVIIAHERGNCSAYNAGWLTALEVFSGFQHLLVIDDDEIADPDWLDRMIEASDRFDADIVGGPQVPRVRAAATAAAPLIRSSRRPMPGAVRLRRSTLPAIWRSAATFST